MIIVLMPIKKMKKRVSILLASQENAFSSPLSKLDKFSVIDVELGDAMFCIFGKKPYIDVDLKVSDAAEKFRGVYYEIENGVGYTI